MALTVEPVPCLKDNYAWLLHDSESQLAAIVDPSEPAPVRRALAERGLRLSHILNTHHHFDHTGGNLPLKQEFGAVVVGPQKDRARIPGIDIGVSEGEPWSFGGHAVRILEIPAHTRGHIAFVFEKAKIAFTGDTLFSMGCGRLFEGTAAMMWDSLSKLMLLEEDMRIFCGHEYTLNNGRFALTLEPGNPDLVMRVREVEILRAKALPTVPSTLGVERRTNPFLRPHAEEIRRALGMERASDVEVFAEMRRRKDSF